MSPTQSVNPKQQTTALKRTLRKVNNPCNRGYKHRCFPPCGHNTSPRLMFLSLKHVIRGHVPTIEHNIPSWSYYLPLGQSNKQQRRTCKNYFGTKIQKIRTNYITLSQTKHNLIIHQIPSNSA